MAFQRFLDPQFIAALNDLYGQGSWWTKLADSPDVFLAIRNNYLNAYSRGMSIGKISWNSGRISLQVHEEYLTKSTDDQYRDLLDENPSRSRPVVSSSQEYIATLPRIKNRARLFAGEERGGTNRVAYNVFTVLDMEAAFDAKQEETETEPKPENETKIKAYRGRMDLVVLGPNLQLTIFEAKLYSNGDLRARGTPKVCGQLREYNAFLVKHGTELEAAYHTVLSCFSQLSGNFFQTRRSHPRAKKILDGRTPLTIDPLPRLLVFGYDTLQQGGVSKDIKRIEEEVHIGGFGPQHIRTVRRVTAINERDLQ